MNRKTVPIETGLDLRTDLPTMDAELFLGLDRNPIAGFRPRWLDLLQSDGF